MTSRYDVISKPDIVTCREIIEWAVARPSRVIKINRAFGKSSMRYFVDFNVNGSFHTQKVDQFLIQNCRRNYRGDGEMVLFLSFSFITKSLSRFSMLDNNF